MKVTKFSITVIKESQTLTSKKEKKNLFTKIFIISMIHLKYLLITTKLKMKQISLENYCMVLSERL